MGVMPTSADEITSFLKEIDLFKECWNQINARIFCTKRNDEFSNLITFITLNYVPESKNKGYIPHLYTEKIFLLDAQFDMSKLSEIIANIGKGGMQYGNFDIKYGDFRNANNPSLPFFSFKECLIESVSYLRNNRFTSFMLTSNESISILDRCIVDSHQN
jgi:hypothetical protein